MPHKASDWKLTLLILVAADMAACTSAPASATPTPIMALTALQTATSTATPTVTATATVPPTPSPSSTPRSSPTPEVGPLYPVSIAVMPAPNGGVRLIWIGTGERAIAAYRIYRQDDDNSPHPIGMTQVTGDNRGQLEYVDATATKPGTYRYYVAAVAQDGTEGQFSAPATITIGP